MCGVCGVAGLDLDGPPLEVGRPAGDDRRDRPSRSRRGGPAHRPGIAMGMRRLSIIDLAASHQPLANERRDIWTVFNGEIFNYPACAAS